MYNILVKQFTFIPALAASTEKIYQLPRDEDLAKIVFPCEQQSSRVGFWRWASKVLNACSSIRRASATIIHLLKVRLFCLQVHSFEGIFNRQSRVRECFHLSVLPANLCEAVGPVGPTCRWGRWGDRNTDRGSIHQL